MLDVRYDAQRGGRFGLAVHRAALFGVLFRAVRREAIAIETGVELETLETGERTPLICGNGRRIRPRVFQALSLMLTPFYQSDSTVMPFVRDRLVASVVKIPPVPNILASMVAGTVVDRLGGSVSRKRGGRLVAADKFRKMRTLRLQECMKALWIIRGDSVLHRLAFAQFLPPGLD